MAHNSIKPKELWKNPFHFMAFGFGSGLLPLMPGTWGTIVAIPIYAALSFLPLGYYSIVLALIFIFGCWLCQHTTRALGCYDHGAIVWDEIAGFLVTMLATPLHWRWIVIGFIMFRIFDIWKPWPINILDKKIRNGFGIMLDDILAGVYAWLLLHLIMVLVR